MKNLRSRFAHAVKMRVHYELTNMAQVEPVYRFGYGIFNFNSPAGTLTFRPRTDKEMTTFRDRYLNAFDQLSKKPGGDERTREFFLLYGRIRKTFKRAKWRANLHTRAKAVLCTWNPLLPRIS